SFVVKGSHTYTNEGNHTVSVTIKDENANPVTGTSTWTVAEAAIAATGTANTVTEGSAVVDQEVGRFTDANLGEPIGQLTVTIDWGDSTTSAGTVSALTHGTVVDKCGQT